ncbi:hypothetical protein SARC_02440 [Sphaeroforma arctica JP610]|uniref:Uncharacterized protein n=1 Tax=Sphaeroforma arctica JP610 TaxID=667725 RepID=A0A0L0G8L7_9EUKA|nr:hypothetical protein SARC_02440 [Sphaeroforma arctica JP610]KNC85382.1 hypothetical protein SARC_02440 [Sphaeroforma arctica JP610]|eukprot:XP_014159284.1 hypothetical protein SARC_02440 [Sphaeroforma arctica JP610]
MNAIRIDARSEYARYAKLDYLGNLDLDDITSPLEKPREMHIDTHCICETYQEKDVRLVLHFDVNKTIIMQDQAANKSVEDTVNDVLCDSTWGIIDVEPLVPTWTACLKHPSIKPPVIEGELIGSYKTFVDRYYLPYTPLRAGETKEEMIARHTKVRTKRRGMVSTFTSKGHPGECFRKFYRRLLDRLKIEQVVPLKKSEQFDEPLRTFVHKETVVDNVEEDGNYDNAQPDSVADTLKGQRGSSAAIDENQVDKPFDTKYHFLIPSFFELILHLTKVDRQFYLIFRTFGTELMNVLKALQDFCEGNHKDYPFVPKSLTAKLIPPHMHDNHQIAAMYRDGLQPMQDCYSKGGAGR